MPTYFFAVWLFFLLGNSLCFAQEQRDVQSWWNITAVGPLSQQPDAVKFKFWLEGVLRLGDDSSRSTQRIFRPGLGYALNDTTSVWLGYAWINTAPPLSPEALKEQRMWQQLLWVKKYEQSTLTSRLRFEQRFFSNHPVVGWRLRELVKFSLPWSYNSKWSLVGIDEVFVHYSHRKNYTLTGFDQNRFFMGLAYKLNAALSVEVGYLNQYVYRYRNSDFLANNLATNFLFNFN